MIPRKPFLLRAMVEWAEANGLTPLLAVDARQPGVQVPAAYVEDGRITLNVSFSAMNQRQITNELITGLARFGGRSEMLSIPVEAVSALVVRETGEGMVFPEEPVMADETGAQSEPAPATESLRLVQSEDDRQEGEPTTSDSDEAPDEPPRPPRGRPSLKLIK